MEERIKKVLADLFDVSIKHINEEFSASNVSTWDSLKQINLVIALESEFEVTFTPEQIVNMTSFNIIKDTISMVLRDDR